MDWKSFVDQFDPMTCILSVEKREDGGYGTIRFVTGNQSYLDSLALAGGGVDVDSNHKTEFVPNSEYTCYIPKDLNFEDVCYRCAILKQPMQNLVHMLRYPFDIKSFFMPLAYEEEGLAYCSYSQILIPKTDENLMTMDISLETAMDVISTCVKLRGDAKLYDHFAEVIEDIRILCNAEYCCALLMDESLRACSVLGEARAPQSGLPWMETWLDDSFYDLAETWLDTIGGSFCLVVRNKHDMEYICERNHAWYLSLAKAGVESMIIFPLFADGHFFGYIWVANYDVEKTERIKNTLDLASHFIAAEIAGRQAARTEGGSDRVDHLLDSLRKDLGDHLNHLNIQANSMITAMASDYRSVYYVNLDKNEGVCYRGDPNDKFQTPRGVHFPYLERFTWYANHMVTDNYREGFLAFIEPDHIRRSLASKPIIAYRYLARHDGREYYEMIRMAGVRRAEDREDHIVHSIGLGFTDIDAEVRETMAKNEALAEALSVAQEANRAKTAFLSNMSHEIRTPMNAIIGLNKLALRNEDLGDKTREYLEKIGESARHLLGLINDILDMSRIESGHVDLGREKFSFPSMLDQINLMVMSQCNDKGLAYECRILNQVDDYYIGDDLKLKEVLINILSNAIKFTDAPGSVTMTVECTSVYEDQSTLRFCIMDTGIGMDQNYIPKIFDAFSQEDSSSKNKYGSTGLGMAITKGILDIMNGSIDVESEKGVGTTFTVTLTLKNCLHEGGKVELSKGISRASGLVAGVEGVASAGSKEGCEERDGQAVGEGCEATGNQASKESHELNSNQEARGDHEETVHEAAIVDLAGRRILLAEDMEINAEIMMDLLELEDIEVEHAENGKIAVEMFADHDPGYYDAVLMDIRMPVMDGLEAAAAIRGLARADAKNIPIVALTANAFEEDVQRSLQVGMNAHLSKPVDSELLLETLGRFIYEQCVDKE